MAETREFQFANIAESELFAPINAVQTNLILLAADDFPDPNYGAVVSLVLRDDANGKFEVMYMVDRVGASCIVERGKEGSTAQTWPAGTIVKNSLTAGFFEKLASLPRTRFRTSMPYPYIFTDSMDGGGDLRRAEPALQLGGLGSSGDNSADALNSLGQPIEGILDTLLLTYNNYPPEETDVSGQPIEGVIDSVLVTYGNYPAEELDVSGQPIEGIIDAVLVTYNNYQVESMDVGGTVLSGELT